MPYRGKPITLAFPVYHLDVFAKAVEVVLSAYRGSVWPDRVIVVDNSEGSKFSAYYHGADPNNMNDFPYIDIWTTGENLGLCRTWNLILSECDDWCFLPGDDCVFHEDTMKAMIDTAVAHPEAGIIYPSRITDPADPSMSPWSFFMQRKWLFEKIGPYDEGFFPVYFADNDYARRMMLAGIPEHVGIVGADVTAGHWGSATVKASKGKDEKRHHETFRACAAHYVKKWGGEPGVERFTTPFDA